MSKCAASGTFGQITRCRVICMWYVNQNGRQRPFYTFNQVSTAQSGNVTPALHLNFSGHQEKLQLKRNATTSSHLNLCRHRQRFVSQTFPKMHASVHFQICCKIPLDFSAQAHNNESAAFNRAASREKLIQNRQTPPDWFGFSPNKMRIFYVCISPSVPFSYGRQGQGGHLPTGSILPVSHTLPFVCRLAVWERKGGINR